jgi:fumarate hydratase class II
LLSDASLSFANKCISGIKPNKERIDKLMNDSLMLVTALSPSIGYDNASVIAKKAHKNGTSIKEEAIKSKLIDEKTFDNLVDPKKMIKPNK